MNENAHTFTHSLTQLLTHSLTQLLTHSKKNLLGEQKQCWTQLALALLAHIILVRSRGLCVLPRYIKSVIKIKCNPH